MSASEFLTMMGIIIVGLIFFVIAKTFIFDESGRVKEYGYKGEAESIVSLIERVSTEPNEFVMYCQDISLCNIEVKGGILVYEKEDVKYSLPIPKSVKVVTLDEIATICVVKTEDGITLSRERPDCVVDNSCIIDECKEDCPDCYGPADICVGDGYCNKAIGENCRSSEDCICDSEKVCCPESVDADDNGCTDVTGFVKGDECWCTSQCESGLECNPTTEGFSDYENACCDPDMSWDGNDCGRVSPTIPCDSINSPADLPSSWDWRNVGGKNWMTPIRNQGNCGSCVTFAVAGTMEGMYNIEQNDVNTDPNLAEQYLMACGTGGGCTGWNNPPALAFVKASGVTDEACFPYKATDLPCSNRCADWNSKLWSINSFTYASSVFEIKKMLICHGPMVISVSPWPGSRYGHAISLVGYDDNAPSCMVGNSGSGCWIFKNSWGTGYGNSGYGTIYYGTNGVENGDYYITGVIAPT